MNVSGWIMMIMKYQALWICSLGNADRQVHGHLNNAAKLNEIDQHDKSNRINKFNLIGSKKEPFHPSNNGQCWNMSCENCLRV